MLLPCFPASFLTSRCFDFDLVLLPLFLTLSLCIPQPSTLGPMQVILSLPRPLSAHSIQYLQYALKWTRGSDIMQHQTSQSRLKTQSVKTHRLTDSNF